MKYNLLNRVGTFQKLPPSPKLPLCLVILASDTTLLPLLPHHLEAPGRTPPHTHHHHHLILSWS